MRHGPRGSRSRPINLSIEPVSDESNYGVVDYWSSPLATLAKGSGDGEDYAVTRYLALQQLGVPAENLRIVIVRDQRRDEDHAVTVVRYEGAG